MIYTIFNFLVKAAEVSGPGNIISDSDEVMWTKTVMQINIIAFVIIIILLVAILVDIKHIKRKIK